MFPVSVKGVLCAPGGEIVLLINDRGECLARNTPNIVWGHI